MQNQWQQDTGSAQSPLPYPSAPPPSPNWSSGSEGKLKLEPGVWNTGRLSWGSDDPRDFVGSPIDSLDIGSPLAVKQRKTTSGKTIPRYLAPGSKWEPNFLADPVPLTGMPSEPLPNWENLTPSPPMFMFAVIINCAGLAKTIFKLWRSNELLMSSGVRARVRV